MSRHYYTGLAVPLPRNNIDTDQIMPARFCYRPTRTGHSESVFGDWRKDPNFVLNDPKYIKASILVTGREFATGSSREYAVWGLKDYGFKVIIAPSYGDIFYKNAIINDLLPLKVTEEDIELLWSLLKSSNNIQINVDLIKDVLTINNNEIDINIDSTYKKIYIENKDHIEMSLENISEILNYEDNLQYEFKG